MNAASWLEGLPAADKWRELLLARGPRIATWILALALGVQAAIIVTNLAGSGAPKPTAAALASTPATNTSVNVAAIVNTHLFGKPPVSAASQDAAHAPQTAIPLVLTGIIAADDPRDGLAILGQNAASAKVYAVGDSVPGGAKLHSVYTDRVVIEHDGNLESLALPRQVQSGAPPPSAAALQTQAPVLERMRKLISEDPGLMADIMRPQPVFAQGKQKGYRVYPGRNREAFTRLGLHPGDLVTAINGTPLDDPSRGAEIFRTLGSSSEARITVERSGQQQDLTLNIAQVAQEAEALAGAQGTTPADQSAQPSSPTPAQPPGSPDPSR
ncbi:MAG TPA: type II secretion system protein GspC [Steroidobacteraceae bacterium]